MPPSSEVIQDWADYVAAPGSSSSGPYTFERSRMEKAIQFVCVEQAERDRTREKERRAKSVAAGKKVKKDDVEFLVSSWRERGMYVARVLTDRLPGPTRADTRPPLVQIPGRGCVAGVRG